MVLRCARRCVVRSIVFVEDFANFRVWHFRSLEGLLHGGLAAPKSGVLFQNYQALGGVETVLLDSSAS